jgi:hypothetical protein
MSSCKVIGLILIIEYCSILTDHLDMSVFLVSPPPWCIWKWICFNWSPPLAVYVVFFFCSTFNSSNNFTIPDTDLCWENVGVTRIGAYRIFLVSSLLQGQILEMGWEEVISCHGWWLVWFLGNFSCYTGSICVLWCAEDQIFTDI